MKKIWYVLEKTKESDLTYRVIKDVTVRSCESGQNKHFQDNQSVYFCENKKQANALQDCLEKQWYKSGCHDIGCIDENGSLQLEEYDNWIINYNYHQTQVCISDTNPFIDDFERMSVKIDRTPITPNEITIEINDKQAFAALDEHKQSMLSLLIKRALNFLEKTNSQKVSVINIKEINTTRDENDGHEIINIEHTKRQIAY